MNLKKIAKNPYVLVGAGVITGVAGYSIYNKKQKSTENPKQNVVPAVAVNPNAKVVLTKPVVQGVM